MRIAIIVHSLGFGGVEKNVRFLSNGLSNNGHDVYVFYIKGIVPSMEDVQGGFNNSVHIVELQSTLPKGVRRLSQLVSAIHEAKKNKIQILIGFTIFPNLFSVLIGKFLRIPSIISERGDPYREFGNSMMSNLLISILSSASGAVFQTNEASKRYKKRIQLRGAVIPNPIFIHDELPESSPTIGNKVISLGRLDNNQKRYDVMLDAFSIFHQNNPDYSLLIYGDGMDSEVIGHWIEEKELKSSVKLMGKTEHSLKTLSEGGIFLITSDYEGISNSLLEAMACGLPVVSTDCSPGGARMVIRDHFDGIIVPCGDVQAIAIALNEYSKNPQLAESCGKHARDVKVRFDPDVIFSKWSTYIMDVYNKYVE